MTPGDDAPTSGAASLRSKIGKVAAASAGALFVSELVSLGQTVALARLLSPTEVGFFVAGTVLISFVENFVEGGLRSGLIHREHDLDDAAQTVFWATLAMGGLTLLVTLAAAPLIGLLFHSRTAGLVAASMSGAVLFLALTNVPEALLQRQFNVRRRLLVGPAVSITFAVVSVTLAALGFGVWSMVAGSYASYVVWVVVLWVVCDWRPGRGRASFRLWRELARFGFPLVLGMFGDRTQKIAQAGITGGALGPGGLGFLRYGERIARIPVNAMVQVGSYSLFPAFARISAERARFGRAYLRALGLSTVGAAAVSAMLVAIGEPLVVVVLGEKWRGAGILLAAMAGLGVGKAFMTVSEEAIKGAGQTRLLNWCTVAELSLCVLLLVLLIGPLGLVGVGISISLTAMVVGVLVMALARPVVGVTRAEIVGVTVPPILSALVALAVMAPVEHWIFHSDTRGVLAGLGLLTLDGLVFISVYLLALRLITPVTFKSYGSDALTVFRMMTRGRGRQVGASGIAGVDGAQQVSDTA